MIIERPYRMALIVAAAAFALVMRASPAAAVVNEDPAPKPPASAGTDNKAGNTKSKAKDKAGTTDKNKAGAAKSDKKSELQFRDGYHHAYDLIYRHHDYVAGIAALRALGRDSHPDVATMIGYSSRKLGRYDDAKYWYEKALAADPRHATTLSYMGMWYAEQGNRLKAEDYLEKVRLICGSTDCREYRKLKGVIAGTTSY